MNPTCDIILVRYNLLHYCPEAARVAALRWNMESRAMPWSPGQDPCSPCQEVGRHYRQKLMFNQEFRLLDEFVVIGQVQGQADSLSAVSVTEVRISKQVHDDKVRPRQSAHGMGSGSVGPMASLETGTPMVQLKQGLRELQGLWETLGEASESH